MDLKALQSKAHAHGRTQREKEFLALANVSSQEELLAIVAEHRKTKDEQEAAAAAEREEKMILASKLTAAERRVKELERSDASLKQLRQTTLEGEVKAAALAAGCYPDAVDLLLVAATPAVKWSPDFTSLEVASLENPEEQLEGIPALIEQLRKKRGYLFGGDGRSGSGVPRGRGGSGSGAGGRPRGGGKPAGRRSSIEERAAWGKDK